MQERNEKRAGAIARARMQGTSIVAIRIVGAGIALLAQILAARMLGADEFGRYSLVLVWLLVLGYAATAGSNQLICRHVAQYRQSEDRERLAGLLRGSLASIVGVAVLLALAAVAVVSLAPLGLSRTDILLATLAFSAVPLLALQDYLESIARGLDRPALGIGPAFLIRHLGIIAGLLTLLVLGEGADAITVVVLTITGLIASILTQFALLFRYIRLALSGVRPRYEIRAWVRTALPMVGSDVTEILLLNADILILGLFVSPDQVALYFAATRLAQVLAYVPYGATAATAQKYAMLSAPGDRDELQTLIGQTATLSTVLTGLGALALTLLAPFLLFLFGEFYVDAAPLVALLAAGIVLSCAFGPGENVLNMLGQERICSIGFLCALVVNVALNFALIPAFGLAGAAIATLTALAFRGVLLAYFAKSRLGLVLPAFVSLAGAAVVPRRAT